MALTRKMLRAMGIEDEKIDEIITAHTETVDALKEERDGYKETAERLPSVENELNTLKNNNTGDWQNKYNLEHQAFENYKSEQAKKDSHRAKETAYRELLKIAGISDKRLDTVLKVTDVDALELDDKGKIKNAADLTESVKTEWSDFIVNTQTSGVNTTNPPVNSGGKMTKDEIYKKDDNGRYVLSASERQNALAEIMASEN